MKFFRALWFRFFPPRFDPLTGGEEAYIVRQRDATPEALNDADLARMRVRQGGTPGKLNYKRSDPHHPKYREYLAHANRIDISESSCYPQEGRNIPERAEKS